MRSQYLITKFGYNILRPQISYSITLYFFDNMLDSVRSRTDFLSIVCQKIEPLQK